MNENLALTEATYYILIALRKGQHGYGIMQEVEDLSKGRVKLAAGTLYGALSNLTSKKWIKKLPMDEDSRKKEYVLTDLGLDVLKKEIERLEELLENGKRFIGEDHE